MTDALPDPIRVAVIDDAGLVTNAIMVGSSDVAPKGFRFVEDEKIRCVPGDTWDGENFVSPEGVVRSGYVPEIIGPSDNPEPETL